ncbi:MAG: radical SAM family heme chaperone HemW [Defluviitaleaceae bacterium]|nr:radical SAM family heme chaperone HemW [Defluviitaleaceae bacterium]
MEKKIGIYIHIPFCATRCGYCDFLTFSCGESQYEPYTKALIREINTFEELKKYKITSIFIGGGTPTTLSPNQIERIMESLNKYNICKNAEITIEANPGTLNLKMLRAIKNSGINRLSLGLQATQHKILKRINRSHTFDDFLENYKNARKLGFNNINIDLMFSLPGFKNFNEGFKAWVETLQIISNINPEHISLYSLIIEEGTPFFTQYEKGILIPQTEEKDRRMYHFACNFLAKKGYNHYEISNFSKKDYECKHNKMYWQRGSYKGFGLGAHSFFEGSRFNNMKKLEEYINANTILYENINSISEKEAMEEFMFLGLRLIEGINIEKFENTFNVNIYEVYGKAIEENLKNKLLQNIDKNLSLTKSGLDISNRVMADFLL